MIVVGVADSVNVDSALVIVTVIRGSCNGDCEGTSIGDMGGCREVVTNGTPMTPGATGMLSLICELENSTRTLSIEVPVCVMVGAATPRFAASAGIAKMTSKTMVGRKMLRG